MRVTCPNCLSKVTELKGMCVAEALASVLVERGASEARALEMLRTLDTDALWSYVGPAIDALEEGKFTDGLKSDSES